MIPKGCVVQGFREVFSPDSVRAYRHYGFLVVESFLPPSLAHQLTTTCNTAVRQRGDNIFPGLDAQHRQGATVSLASKLSPLQTPGGAADTGTKPLDPATPLLASSTSLGFGNAPLPPDLQKELETAERDRHVETRLKKVRITLKGQRAVDRAYRRLTKARARYNAYRRIREYVTPEEEMAGDMSEERIQELQSKYTYEDFQRSFQHYRDSGLMEKEIRRDNHINDAMTFMQDWPRTWCWLWHTSPKLKALAVSAEGAVAQLVGEAAGCLAGEVVLRVYSDNATEATSLSNAAPLGFAGAATNFAHPHALCAQLGLEQPNSTHSGATTVVVPGSHHVVRRISLDGRELDRFQSSGIFDVGSMVRGLPEVSHLPVIALPPLSPGAALFFNNYLLMGTQENLFGAAQNVTGTVGTGPVAHVINYALSLIPDRCVFDGKANSWASRDSHGPLYSYKRGQLLTDDAVFPVIHRALDIE
ncbi:conserved hypothetical protein [Leishmania braziliensis MHOM/BR/75/M2904]|uniref:Uncharacterized protein n=2 Tax=Leishmania braziliensis TaxID=5660 RepID=A4H722_LEIBR|nr:conserved hypothetical protein [Leishmania braziliensis MHOM/BR/75/M2904]KAI5688618.1 hypothetical protein MNV84_01666 [Leishmania braziliensis]CAJ2468569.1 unnamed protein product [Leishmania braziliensis]CAJ2469135.1 unnamed protein product [Leishmania braziliensis]CAM45577.1 conserved hypothetical protein [Leishmania braziliensis MHOM/BR/75/M2904]SYZ63805.1 hypothetical_protein [Leishmania braziliensis MHOM/BR/75/M2904]